MHTLDLIILFVVGFSTLLAFFRGLITEFLSLLVWVGAFYITGKYASDVSILLKDYLDEPLRSLIGFSITFLGTLLVGGLVNILITFLFRFLKIGFPDRILGAVFGFLRGMVVIGIANLLISKTPFANQEFVEKIASGAKSWKNDSSLQSKIGPILVDLLTSESTFSPYARQTGKLLSNLLPKGFLSPIDASLLDSLISPKAKPTMQNEVKKKNSALNIPEMPNSERK